MRKLTFFIACLFLIGVGLVHAQSRSVSGKVLSADDGQPIIGATVMVKGTSTGTITDVNGNFTVNVPANATTLWVSYVGMKTIELQAANNMVVRLESDARSLDEVVVTAFGMKRERRALGYAVQDVKGEDLVKAGSSSIATALQGKLSGVEIKPSSGMPGASAQITIRGARSFSGNNQPLFVIDGMPVSSTADYSTGNSVTGVDNANRSVDIDPNDIESINILKGQAAAALYGIRASNGVVVITTKSGKGSKTSKPIISVSTSASNDRISRKPEYQTTYGQGTPVALTSNAYGYVVNTNSSQAWGPKIVDLPKSPTHGGETSNQYTTIGGVTTAMPGKYYVPQRALGGLDPWAEPGVYDNVGNFFKIGNTVNTALNLSQATDKSNYSFGIGNTTQTGIIPGTAMDRITAKVAAETKLSKALKTGFSANYSQIDILKSPGANDGLVAAVFGAPTSYDLKGIPFASPTDPATQILYRATNFNNPYWAVKNNKFNEKTNRFFGNAYIEFSPKISDDGDKSLTFRYQAGADSYTTHLQDIHEVGSQRTSATAASGRITNRGVSVNNYNSLLTAVYDMTIFDDIKLNVMLGNEINDENYKYYSMTGSNFNFYGWAHINNATIKNASESIYKSRTVGMFGNLMLSYKDMLYLNATGRQDVVSTMPRNNRTFFYPSVSLGFVASELEVMKSQDILSFAKLRASYAQVGQAGSYYDNFYVLPSYAGGFWSGTPNVYPMGGVTSYIPSTTLYDPNLKPQNTISYEFGVDLRFLKNLIGIDYTYSRQDVKDQIFSVPLAGSTGASSLVMNGGSIFTNTHEVVLTLNPIRTKNLDWTINVNYTKMENKVTALAPGVESIFLGGFVTPQVRANVGSTFPVIYGTQFKKDDKGRVLVDERVTVNNVANASYGMPMAGTPGVIGTVSPDFVLGGSTSIRYKGITLSTTIDWKSGGQMYHGTNGLMQYVYGVAKSTEDRTTPFTYPGFKADGTPNNIERGGPTDHTAYFQLNANVLGNIDEAYIFNNSYLKMRELTLSYKLPKIYNIDITVSGFARNFLLWTNLPNFDPEATQGNTNMGGAFERFTTPQASSVGMGINLLF
ncbi:MAG: SusC/RagA family TonB-linked outer membrane protein [Paludibacter sp.]|nr:SusC/RagA family TonB-linked outer membrane protein [Paludibacter sp.]